MELFMCTKASVICAYFYFGRYQMYMVCTGLGSKCLLHFNKKLPLTLRRARVIYSCVLHLLM